MAIDRHQAHLAEHNLDKLVSWWHTDGELECINDMTKSRLAGFSAVQPTPASFCLFDRLKADRIIPM